MASPPPSPENQERPAGPDRPNARPIAGNPAGVSRRQGYAALAAAWVSIIGEYPLTLARSVPADAAALVISAVPLTVGAAFLANWRGTANLIADDWRAFETPSPETKWGRFYRRPGSTLL